MKIIAGLGNFGLDYIGTRHNMGFEVVEGLAEDLGLSLDKVDFQGRYVKANIEGETVFIVEPLTYMNLSGTCIVPLMRYYKIPVEDLIVICDDMAIKPGEYRIKIKGSSGGQKGLQNIIDNLGTTEFKRIRIGTGEPKTKAETVDYVLGKPSKEDRELINKAEDEAIEFLHLMIKFGFQRALSLMSAKKSKENNAK